MEEAERLLKLPTYVFALLDKLKAEERLHGKDLIDLTIGSPNLPPPPEVIATMQEALRDPENHRYSSFEGDPAFRQAIINWCKREYNVSIQPNEIVELIGSKEGVVHLAFAFLNPGDRVLVPQPAYPAHFRGPILAGAQPYIIPTTESNNFVPDLDSIDETIAREAKMLILSYPTNPTAALAPRELFTKAIAFAKKHNLILLHDFAYAELYFEGHKPISMLSLPGAKEVCIEFHSLSKTFGMAGWRVGFAVGNAQIIESLRKIKTNLDYGPFKAAVKAGTTALNLQDGYRERMRATYQNRRDIFMAGLTALGWQIRKPMATFYVWFPVPQGFNSMSFTLHLLKETGVVVSPGTGFGELGEGYVRAALVDTDERIKEALERLQKAGIRYHA